MKKGDSLNKNISKGKSMSSIQPYQESRATNKSNDMRKNQSKISKVSKANSCIKIHQPLTIQNRTSLKQSKLQNSKIKPSSAHQSRRKIQSHLQNKQSFNQNPVSFRPSQNNNKTNSFKTKDTKSLDSNKLAVQNQKLLKENRELKEKYFRMQQTALEDKEKIKNLIMRISQIKRQKGVQHSTIGTMSKTKTTASYAHIIKTRGLTQRQNFLDSHNKINPQQETPFRILHGAGNSTSQSKYSRNKQTCHNSQCEQRKKYLQNQLYKQRIKRDQLEEDKKQWQRNRQVLKRQYQDLLFQIQNLREEGNQEYC